MFAFPLMYFFSHDYLNLMTIAHARSKLSAIIVAVRKQLSIGHRSEEIKFNLYNVAAMISSTCSFTHSFIVSLFGNIPCSISSE